MEKLPSIMAHIRAIIVVVLLLGCMSNRLPSSVSMLGSYLHIGTRLQVHTMFMPKEEVFEVVQTTLEIPLAVEVVPTVVYDGMTMKELSEKLDRSLYSTLSGYGSVFAEKSIAYGVDPYVALAIVLHETGCAFGHCSTLASQCNNIGGMKGSPSCGGGPYRSFTTLDEGIDAFIKNLSKNYYQKGLTTVEQIGKKYAESDTWSTKVNFYINKIKAN